MKNALFNVWVAFNMLLCSVAFFGKSLPRETISGFIGRRAENPRNKIAKAIEKAIDFLYFKEKLHCRNTAYAEALARIALYR